MGQKGVVAAGHIETTRVAAQILEAGGNAFDAVIAAQFAACVAEPVLTSLAGGGFLLAAPAGDATVVYDFFVQTPKQARPVTDIDFYPISANFGTTRQEFHIGMGAMATPGTVKGISAVHKDLCTMPLSELVAPAIQLARRGVTINALQAYIFQVVGPIYLATREAAEIYGSQQGGQLVGEGKVLRQSQLADTLEVLAAEGEAIFYRGELAKLLTGCCNELGGHLTAEDLASYEVIKRHPLSLSYRNARVLTNAPPSSGGILIAFALKLLEGVSIGKQAFGSATYLGLLAEVMDVTNKARLDGLLGNKASALLHLLDPGHLEQYRHKIFGRSQSLRGTTHISVMDAAGNIASLSSSNGEGCGHMLPDTGIMLNNMLGEQDLNPLGFHQWQSGQRMTSMMAPTMVWLPNGARIALGSGGSNRLRTAILQILLNLIDFKMDLREAVIHPRIHYEDGMLHVESGFDIHEIERLIANYPQHNLWDGCNLFFGGAHSVMSLDGHFDSAGDPRRGGHTVIV